MKNFYIAIIGCANTGKSTLINRLSNQKISIVSSIPQTTRNAIPCIIKNENANWLIYDTPGILKAKNKLDLFLINESLNQIKNSNVIIFLVDSSKKYNDEIKTISQWLNKFETSNKKTILIFSKIDLIDENESKFIELKNEVLSKINKVDKIFLMNNKSDDLNLLIDEINNSASLDENINIQNHIDEKLQDNLLIVELIREQIIKNTFQEVPHSCAVIIDNKKYDAVKNIFHIYCSIVVEKESQKAIIIGKNASKIKKIGIEARKEIENIYDCKINLKLFCKVEKDWRNNNYLIKDFGYKKWQK
ncbi:GTPase Era [Mycoplasmoides pirum]|uniref:GTPase Era n=1 Tax=Mycoplasmoides pirum TaxID=2122 RepID=UPI000487AD66|nr:GTPase Era [Mycoplasmoides pirum]